jgi:probable HAF family extracellular repeat protein
MKALLALAFAVRALALPAHSTIDSFGGRSMMAVSRDGTVAATVIVGGFESTAIVWNAAGGWHAVRPPSFDPGADSVDASVAGFDANGALLANAAAAYGTGAIRSMQYRAMRVAGARETVLDFGACGDPQHSPGPALGGAYDDGDLLATMQSPPLVDLNDLSGQLAPVAVRLRGSECTYLGNGSLLAAAGEFAAGYAGYVGNVPQSPSVVAKQRYVALRWHGDERSIAGPGVAFAVNASGTAAGADAPPGLGATFGLVPHARVWPLGGEAVSPVPGAAPSVAYAIDARGRVAGMLESADGRHHAFLWENGKLELLEDLVRAPDWRFECAYAFTPSGGIAGIGIHRGTPAAFVIENATGTASLR